MSQLSDTSSPATTVATPPQGKTNPPFTKAYPGPVRDHHPEAENKESVRLSIAIAGTPSSRLPDQRQEPQTQQSDDRSLYEVEQNLDETLNITSTVDRSLVNGARTDERVRADPTTTCIGTRMQGSVPQSQSDSIRQHQGVSHHSEDRSIDIIDINGPRASTRPDRTDGLGSRHSAHSVLAHAVAKGESTRSRICKHTADSRQDRDEIYRQKQATRSSGHQDKGSSIATDEPGQGCDGQKTASPPRSE